MSFPDRWSWLPPVLLPSETIIRSQHMMQVREAIDYLLRRAQDKNDPIARATYASTAGYATNAGHANNADYATNAGHATIADAVVGGGGGGDGGGTSLAKALWQTVVVTPVVTYPDGEGMPPSSEVTVNVGFEPDLVFIQSASPVNGSQLWGAGYYPPGAIAVPPYGGGANVNSLWMNAVISKEPMYVDNSSNYYYGATMTTNGLYLSREGGGTRGASSRINSTGFSIVIDSSNITSLGMLLFEAGGIRPFLIGGSILSLSAFGPIKISYLAVKNG